MGYVSNTGYFIECDECGRRHPDGEDGIWGWGRDDLVGDLIDDMFWYAVEGVVETAHDKAWCGDCVSPFDDGIAAPDGTEVDLIEGISDDAFDGATESGDGAVKSIELWSLRCDECGRSTHDPDEGYLGEPEDEFDGFLSDLASDEYSAWWTDGESVYCPDCAAEAAYDGMDEVDHVDPSMMR